MLSTYTVAADVPSPPLSRVILSFMLCLAILLLVANNGDSAPQFDSDTVTHITIVGRYQKGNVHQSAEKIEKLKN